MLPAEVLALLSPEAQALVDDFFDAELRAKIVGALHACAHALRALDQLDLDRYELLDLDLPDLSVWNDAAPSVRDALMAVHATLATLSQAFPPTEAPRRPSIEPDLDAAFSEIGAEDFEHSRTGAELDRLVSSDLMVESVETSLGVLVAMLRQDITKFGKQLRDPQVVASRWSILGELQEFRTKCTQCLEAIAAAILRPLSRAPVGELLPRYTTELQRSVLLLAELRALVGEVARINDTLELADLTSAAELRRGLIERLDRFGESSSYRHLWARDKREIILARIALRSWDPAGAGLNAFRQQVDGLTRFLEVLVDAVSRRPEVQDYERAQALGLPGR
ncbi:MAG: hypothetical protein IT384_04575 [Deltaproteobacteria bacterium]|nr:hypothetical protein [Deltaproteobacteria bacterium]